MKITEIPEDELLIKSFDNQNKKDSSLHPNLLQHPFSLLLCAPKNSGKTNLLLRLLLGNRKPKGAQNDYHKFYKHYFDKVYIFSPTWNNDEKTQKTGIPQEQVYEEPELYHKILHEILLGQDEEIEEEGKENADKILLVMDDLAGQKGVFSGAKGIMNRLAFNHRHANASIIITSQGLRQINSAFRDNFSAVIFFSGISNRLELNKIYEEYLGDFTKDEANELLEYIFDGRYNFLFINFQKGKESRYFKNFNQLKLIKNNDRLV